MSNKLKINTYATLGALARKLRNDLAGVELILLYAYNRTGKTRLSMEFKDVGKRKTKKNPDSTFFNGLKDFALDPTRLST